VLAGRRLSVYLFCCAVWGSTWLVIRIGVKDVPPLRLAAMRMGLACVCLIPLALRARSRPSRAEWVGIAWAGFLQIGVAYAAIFLAATRIESGLSAVLFGAFPIWVALFAHWLLPDEPLTVRTAAAALAGLTGVLVIEGPAAASALHGARDAGPIWIGGLLVIASSVVSAYSNVYVKKKLVRVSPVVNVWGQTLVGSVVLFAAALAFEPGRTARWTAVSIGALLYLAIAGTVLTFVALYWLVPRVPMSVIGTIPLVDTVIAVMLGAVFLGEALPLRVFGGGLLIVAGVLLATSSGPAPARAGAPGGRPT